MKGKWTVASCEANTVFEGLKKGLRVDGRTNYDFRVIAVNFHPTISGHCQAQLGRTRVLARVYAEVMRPYPDRPTDGFLNFNTEFSPMASPYFEVGRPSIDAVHVSRMIERTLRESRAIDTEGLCIKAGEKVWSIRTDIHILDDEGNLIDCACIAAISALLHFRRPEVAIIDDEVIVYPPEQKNPVPLSIHHIPICVTFGFFAEGDYFVVDPSLLEEQVMESEMTIAMNIAREVCAISKPGGIPLLGEDLLRCTKIATVKVTEITQIIKKALGDAEKAKKAK
jgi:exosome complex component RRP45